MKLIFYMKINIKLPCNLISTLNLVPRVILRKDALETRLFQHCGHQSFLQGDTIIIDGHDQAFSKYSK